jgi:hypothetical protein
VFYHQKKHENEISDCLFEQKNKFGCIEYQARRLIWSINITLVDNYNLSIRRCQNFGILKK